jgi:uncharacterized protein
MKTDALKKLVPLVSGFVFALGLGLGGMTQPQKVTAFLDLFGHWDPSLMFVMGGAILVHMPVFLWLRKRDAANGAAVAVEGCGVVVPSAAPKLFDLKLVGGAAIFGAGWGLGGFCPGPGLVSLGTGSSAAVVFVLGMAGAMVLFARVAESLAKYRLPSWPRPTAHKAPQGSKDQSVGTGSPKLS